MGQKVSPVGLRVGVNRNWDSRWYANDQDFAGLLHEDIKVRDYILKKLKCRKALCFKAFRHFFRNNMYNSCYNTESLVKYLHFEPGQIFITLRVIILISNRIT